MNIARVLVVVVGGCVCFSSARGWDAVGHLLVDSVAAERLSPEARRVADGLVRQLEFPGRSYDFITAGCWMDDIKTRRKDVPLHGLFRSWHYIDLGVGPLAPGPVFPLTVNPGDDKDGDITRGLERAVAVLRGGEDPLIRSRAVALAMVMHVGGELHQPLHCASWYFAAEEPDAGGNGVVISNSSRMLSPAQKKRGYKPHYVLHFFWDTAYRAQFKDGQVFVADGRDYEEASLPGDVAGHLFDFDAVGAGGEAGVPVDFRAWALENHAVARERVYDALPFDAGHRSTSLSREYVEGARVLARQRVVLAGRRLAGLLNEVLVEN
jgi:hypothetical protein